MKGGELKYIIELSTSLGTFVRRGTDTLDED